MTIQTRIDGLKAALGTVHPLSGKRGERQRLRSDFEELCWRQIKGKHDAHFKDAFSGVRNAQARFCDRVLEEAGSNTAALSSLEALKSRAEKVFGGGLHREIPIGEISLGELLSSADPVLGKRVLGKENVDVAELIGYLGNSDWVRQGLGYLAPEAPCPFCQQHVDAALAAKISDYFDETYRRDIDRIEAVCTMYAAQSTRFLDALEALLAQNHRYIDGNQLRSEIDRLSAKLDANMRLLADKRREPSASISLENLADAWAPIADRIAGANREIVEHNRLVDNLATEKLALVAEIWRCLIEENQAAIASYRAEAGKLEQAIGGMENSLGDQTARREEARRELRELERNVTSVEPTVSAINGLLASFGFSGFHLRTTGEHNHLYELVRDDGRGVGATLSEGEKSFVAFLYFYHLIRGSTDQAEVSGERIVVFDDPISSLDSDVLFIVSSLIKRVLKEAQQGSGQIRQVFVLTHNIYFHKEVSFDPKRSGGVRAHETFWVVRKLDGTSKIDGHPVNPIKTSYELLWAEVRNPDRSVLTIQNTLRRIIENYFKILGNVDTDEIVARFEGQDQQICASLFSWVNDGSHSAHDDLYVSVDGGLATRYLSVFREIFIKTEHSAHYQMMMGPEMPLVAEREMIAAANDAGEEAA
ncbi:AAA family ATPase [Novosphingobium resinovorum]|uniref:AAA family ATPase n=2 Tax=Novosphingobium TaxID=165696 RepID=UPI0022F291B8|nr:AAA family ATPase [Novosphingobium resinovorum]GLK46336.1 hypothetical protein GCM10017612_42580 [Novosphingobium resinovorum]